MPYIVMTPAAPSNPAPFPARLPFSIISMRASVNSSRTSVETCSLSRLTKAAVEACSLRVSVSVYAIVPSVLHQPCRGLTYPHQPSLTTPNPTPPSARPAPFRGFGHEKAALDGTNSAKTPPS
ncbi:hypothetical protein Apa02nite_058600 [Actinoplanes palleronii]|uniref:Uncharacterized protein n=1 Tax=Actinoplanes palleronii TaxID=113570 RepID=A0ABQ4BGH0_9ACTN|nr:hypothetical protein Apa02nite_058600 [Actinoplanes palleronii]